MKTSLPKKLTKEESPEEREKRLARHRIYDKTYRVKKYLKSLENNEK